MRGACPFARPPFPLFPPQNPATHPSHALPSLCFPQRRAYQIQAWTGADDFLDQLARRSGKLTRGGEPDANTAAKMVLLDWQRGKVPYYAEPPAAEGVEEGGAGGSVPAHAVTVRGGFGGVGGGLGGGGAGA